MAMLVSVAVRGSTLLTKVNAGAGNFYDDRFWPSKMVDGNASSYWMAPPTSEDRKWLLFNLNGLYTLDRIETYNGSTDWNRQLKSALIEYSVDGATWTTLGGARQTFKTRDQGWDTFNFSDAQARMVRFGSYTNLGGGELWSSFGEVKFYGTEVPLTLSQMDGSTITATASSSYTGRNPINILNGSGIGADADGDGVPTHDRAPGNMWSSAAQGTGMITSQWVRFEFQAPVALDHMLVWNWAVDASGGLDWCLKNARIRYSLNGTDWTTLAEDVQFNTGLGTAWNSSPTTEFYEAIDQFGFGGAQVKYVLIDTMHNFKAANDAHVGLSEVWFFSGGAAAPKGTVLLFQ